MAADGVSGAPRAKYCGLDETLPYQTSADKIAECLDDLKNHLVSVVIAVLAVLYLREAVGRAGDFDLLQLGAALAVMIAALALYLTIKGPRGINPAKSEPTDGTGPP